MSVSIATGNAESDFFLCSNLTEANRNTSNESMELLRKKQSGQLDHSVKTVSIAIIGIGMVLQGVAKSPRGPFTTVYLDDGCDKTKTGFYLGKQCVCVEQIIRSMIKPLMNTDRFVESEVPVTMSYMYSDI